MEAFLNAANTHNGAGVSSAPRKSSFTMYASILTLVLAQVVPWRNPQITWLMRVAFVIMAGLKYLVWTAVKGNILQQRGSDALARRRFFLKPKPPSLMSLVLGNQNDNFGNDPDHYVPSSYAEHEVAIADSELQSIFQSAIALAASLFFGVQYLMLSGVILTPVRLLESPTIHRWLFNNRSDPSPYGDLSDDPRESPPGLQSVIATGSASTELVAAAKAAHAKQGYDFDMEHAIYSAWEDQHDPVLFAAWERMKEASKPVDYRTATHQWSILMVAAGSPTTDAATVRDLSVKLDCKTSAADSTGWTPLHWAAYHGSINGARGVLAACYIADGRLEAAAAAMRVSAGDYILEGDSHSDYLCPTATEAVLTRDSEGYSALGIAKHEAGKLHRIAEAEPADSAVGAAARQRAKQLHKVVDLLRAHCRVLLRAALDTDEDVDVSLEGLEARLLTGARQSQQMDGESEHPSSEKGASSVTVNQTVEEDSRQRDPHDRELPDVDVD